MGKQIISKEKYPTGQAVEEALDAGVSALAKATDLELKVDNIIFEKSILISAESYKQGAYWKSQATMQVGESINPTLSSHGSYYYLNPIRLNKGATLEVYGKSGANTAKCCLILDDDNKVVDYTTTLDVSRNPYKYTAQKDCTVYITTLDSATQIKTSYKNYVTIKELSKYIEELNGFANPMNKPAFCYVDDDFVISSVSQIKDIADELGIKITFAAIPDRDSLEGEDYFSSERLSKIKEYMAEGHNFELHPNHTYWKQSSPTGSYKDCPIDLQRSFTQSCINAYNENLIHNSGAIFIPGGSTDGNVIPALKDMTNCILTTSPGYNDGTVSDLFHLKRQTIKTASETEFNKVKSIIDDAYNNNGWLILYAHSHELTVDSGILSRAKRLLEYANYKCRLRQFEDIYKERYTAFVINGATGK